MTGDKTQPQKLLEEIIPKDLPRDENEKYPSDPEPMPEPKFPSIEAQMDYWRKKEAAEKTPEIDEAFDRLQAAKREYEMNEASRPDAEPKPPRKWSLARRKAYNAKVKAKSACAEYDKVVLGIPEAEQPMAMIKFCPHCGGALERFLA